MALGRKTGGRQKGTPNKVKDPRRVRALADRIAGLIELQVRWSNRMQLPQALKMLECRVRHTGTVLDRPLEFDDIDTATPSMARSAEGLASR